MDDTRGFTSNGWMYKEVPATAGELAKFFAEMDPDTVVNFNTCYCEGIEHHAFVDKETLSWTKPIDGRVEVDLD